MYLTSEKNQKSSLNTRKRCKTQVSAEGQMLYSHSELTICLVLKRKPKIMLEKSLVKLVGKRKRLLDYLKKTEISRYRAIIAELGIRK